MRLVKNQVQAFAREILEESKNGIRWSELLRAVEQQAGDTPRNSVHGWVHGLLTSSDDVVKVARGTYQLAKYVDAADAAAADEALATVPIGNDAAGSAGTLTEQDFYASFAEWLVENDEVTVAEPLGGSSLGGKWGTPDVLGVMKPRAQDIFRFEPQIIAAEIKATPSQPVVAFGQAVAYRLFSHKSYIVVPRTTSSDDMSRLKSLCSIHGVGLVTFLLDKEAPDYLIVVLPALASPDMFYVNTMLERLKSSEPKLLNKLF